MDLTAIKRHLTKGTNMEICDYINSDKVFFIEETSRDGVLQKMVDALALQGTLADPSRFHSAIMDREKLVSTGIGTGIALPHAKLKEYQHFFIAIGILKGQGVDWDALDGYPVKLVFMIGGPEQKQTEYLSILSKLTQALRDEDRRKKMTKASTSDEVLALFKGC